jgi:hypothetical protein
MTEQETPKSETQPTAHAALLAEYERAFAAEYDEEQAALRDSRDDHLGYRGYDDWKHKRSNRDIAWREWLDEHHPDFEVRS